MSGTGERRNSVMSAARVRSPFDFVRIDSSGRQVVENRPGTITFFPESVPEFS
jgi:hypothetical protein